MSKLLFRCFNLAQLSCAKKRFESRYSGREANDSLPNCLVLCTEMNSNSSMANSNTNTLHRQNAFIKCCSLLRQQLHVEDQTVSCPVLCSMQRSESSFQCPFIQSYVHYLTRQTWDPDCGIGMLLALADTTGLLRHQHRADLLR